MELIWNSCSASTAPRPIWRPPSASSASIRSEYLHGGGAFAAQRGRICHSEGARRGRICCMEGAHLLHGGGAFAAQRGRVRFSEGAHLPLRGGAFAAQRGRIRRS
eukprot:1178067-Prorocentrum_minimum.AAC.5